MNKNDLKQYSFCLECGEVYYPVKLDAKFCGSCGKPLSTHCPNSKCKHEIIIPDKHCAFCGVRMVKKSSGNTTFKIDI